MVFVYILYTTTPQFKKAAIIDFVLNDDIKKLEVLLQSDTEAAAFAIASASDTRAFASEITLHNFMS